MKKNRMMRLASVLMVMVLLTTSVISGTFAKYTSSATATDKARVAKWNVLLNDTQLKYTNTFTFDLFSTVVDTKDSNTETDISVADGTIIAPGTKGQMSFELKNFSEVVAEYVIDYKITNDKNIPVVFSLTGNGTDWTDDIDTLDVTTPVNMPIGYSGTITVYWMWAFEGDNEFDTELGIKGTDYITVDATITATQVD